MTHGVNDDFSFARFVENDIWVGRRCKTANSRVVRADANLRMQQQKIDNGLDTDLHVSGALRRMSCNVAEDCNEIGKSRTGVTKFHRPCLAQVERTSSSVANSPRAAAALDAAMVVRFLCDRAMGAAL